MALVEVEGLHRSYKVRLRRRGLVGAVRDLFGGPSETVAALDGVDFSLEPGEIVGYIGPNGAGKSTTIKCLTGILKPSAGSIRVAGLDPWRQRSAHVRNIGVVFGQRTQLWWDLAVIEAYDLLAAIFEIPAASYRARLDELVDLLQVEPLLRKPVRELSLGQRMRCDLVASLLHAPPLVLLDEPTIGLDVMVKQRIRTFIRGMAHERGVAVLLTTHDLGDVEQLSDRVLLLDQGRVMFRGAVSALRAQFGARRRLVVRPTQALTDAQRGALALALGRPVSPREGGSFSVDFDVSQGAAELVSAVLSRVPTDDLSLVEPSIEEIVAAFYQGAP